VSGTKALLASEPAIESSAARQWVLALGLSGLSLSLVVLLLGWSGISLAEAARRLLAAPIWLVGLFTLLTVVQNGLSAWKWHRVVERTRPQEHTSPSFALGLHCAAGANFLSQFLTPYLAAAAVRGWALRQAGGKASFGASTSVYEQAFDLTVLVVIAVPTLVAWAVGGSFAQWLLLTVAALLAGAALLRVGLASRAIAKLEGLAGKSPRFAAMLRECVQRGLLAPTFLLELYGISVARYLTLMLRLPLLVLAVGYPIALSDVLPSFTLVQAAQIAAITPGQLGIREWTWSGVLALRGYDLATAARFAIDLRIVGLVATTLAAVPVLWALRAKGAPR
jgi:uncharacterized membrane protein YbhN (UPF0104 family)